MKICTLKFNAKFCIFKQDTSKPIDKQVEFCKHLQCPHGSVTEREVNSETVAFVSCDLSWNPFDWKETRLEDRELMMV